MFVASPCNIWLRSKFLLFANGRTPPCTTPASQCPLRCPNACIQLRVPGGSSDQCSNGLHPAATAQPPEFGITGPISVHARTMPSSPFDSNSMAALGCLCKHPIALSTPISAPPFGLGVCRDKMRVFMRRTGLPCAMRFKDAMHYGICVDSTHSPRVLRTPGSSVPAC